MAWKPRLGWLGWKIRGLFWFIWIHHLGWLDSANRCSWYSWIYLACTVGQLCQMVNSFGLNAVKFFLLRSCRVGKMVLRGISPPKKRKLGNLGIVGVWLRSSHRFVLLVFAPTIPETNIAPKNWWLWDCFPFRKAHFQGRTVTFREGTCYTPLVSIHQPPAGGFYVLTDPVIHSKAKVPYLGGKDLSNGNNSYSKRFRTWEKPNREPVLIGNLEDRILNVESIMFQVLCFICFVGCKK